LAWIEPIQEANLSPPSNVTPTDPVVVNELPLIRKIIRDETWFEGERRGCAVSPDDPVVRENVCQVIFRVGEELRKAFMEQVSANSQQTGWPGSESNHNQAA
jgi:hypothetical protein